MSKNSLLTKQPSNSNYFTNWDRDLLSFIHELSGPLTAANINLEKYCEHNNIAYLKLLASNIKLMEDYLNSTRQLVKRLPAPLRTFWVNKQLATLCKNLSTLASQKGVILELKEVEDFALRGNPTKFKQVISCFIRNAIESYDDLHSIYKIVKIEHHTINGYLVVVITDNGIGISEIDKHKIFKPYFTTKRSNSGMGIGLSLAAESIKKDFMGYIEIESVINKGTSFSLFFKISGSKDMLQYI